MSRIALEGECTIACIADIHCSLSAAFDTGSDPVELDLGAVSAADITFVQLLASASVGAARSGRSLRIASVPEEIHVLFRRAGLRLEAEGGRVSCS